MTPVRPIENPYAALWRSAATEVLGAGDPLLAAVDEHLTAFQAGIAVEPVDPGPPEDDPQLAAYLSALHHRLAHARATGDRDQAAELTRQRDRFRLGNPCWEQMAVAYLRYYGRYPLHAPGKPAYRSWRDTGDPDFGMVDWTLPAAARVAVVGDVGTGTDVAAAVLLAAMSLRPDAILHLGDVYYSGTEHEFAHRFTGLLARVWRTAGARVPVFTVPGNHEYFTGAHAYFACLDGGRLAVQPAQRQRASFFSLRSADAGWQFLGLDTGFHGHRLSLPAPMLAAALRTLRAEQPRVPAGATAGSLVPATPAEPVRLRDDERDWHERQLRGFPGRTILLSHHQLYSAAAACGVAQRTVPDPAGGTAPDPRDPNRAWVNTALWRQLGAHFGDRVAGWLWGHEHNLNIFADGYRPAGWPATDPALRTLPKGRCLGHGAIPVQEKEDPYATTYPVPLAGDQVRLGLTDGWYNRGFGLLELAGAGRPLTASYFQVAGADPAPLLIHTETIE